MEDRSEFNRNIGDWATDRPPPCTHQNSYPETGHAGWGSGYQALPTHENILNNNPMSDEDILWLWSQLSVLNQPSQAPPVQPFAEGAWGPPVNSGPLGNSPIDIPHETSMFSTYGPRNNPQETFPRSYDYTSQLPSDCYQTAYNGCPAPPTATRTADVSPFSRSYHPLSFTDRSFDERFASGNEQQVAYVNPQFTEPTYGNYAVPSTPPSPPASRPPPPSNDIGYYDEFHGRPISHPLDPTIGPLSGRASSEQTKSVLETSATIRIMPIRASPDRSRGQETGAHPGDGRRRLRKVLRVEAEQKDPNLSGCYDPSITREQQNKLLELTIEPTFPQKLRKKGTCKFCGKFLQGACVLYHARVHLGFNPFQCSNNGCKFRAAQQSDVNKHMRRCPKDSPLSRNLRETRGKRKPRPVDMNAGADAPDSHGTIYSSSTDQENDLLRQDIVPREQDQSVLTRVHIEPAWFVPSMGQISRERHWGDPLDDTPPWPPNSNG